MASELTAPKTSQRLLLKRAVSVLALFAAAGTALNVTTASPANAREIGAVAAANPLIEGTGPSSNKRALYIGARVVENERIFTSSQGSGQVLFDDQTTLTVSPGSDVVLDRYVYDPDTGTGDLGLTITKGAMRFIGGRLSKERDAVVRTPTATIGIRGGMALLSFGPDGSLKVVSIAGAYVKVDTGSETLFLSRPNAAASVPGGAGGPIEYLGLVDAAALDEIYRLFEIEGGGGSAVPPTDGRTAQSGIAVVGSEELGAIYRDPVTTEGGEPAENALLEPLIIGRDFLIDRLATADGGGGGGTVPVIIGTPLPGNTGQGFFAGTGAFTAPGGGVVANPAGSGVFFAPGGTIPFVQTFAGSRIGLGPNGEVVSIPVEQADANGYFSFDASDSDAPSDITGGRGYFDQIDDDNDFTIARFENTIDDGESVTTSLIGAAIIGTPTAGQLDGVGARGPQLVRDYTIDFAIDGDGPGSIVPYEIAQFGPAMQSTLTIVGDPTYGLLPATAAGETNGSAKVGMALFSVTGTGANQVSYFGGLAKPLVSNGVAPTLSGEVFGLGSQSNSGADVATRVDVGTIEDGRTPEGAGETQPDAGSVFYGPEGEYVVLGTAARGLDDDPDVDFGTGSATVWGEGVGTQTFGLLAFGESEGDTPVWSNERFSVAATSDASLASLGLAPNTPGVEPNFGVFTGGFTASISQERNEDTGAVKTVANRTTSAHLVSGVLDKGANSAAVTFDRALSGHDGVGKSLTFGGADNGSAFVDDKRFIAESRQTEAGGADAILATNAASGTPDIYPNQVTYSDGARAVQTEHKYLTWGHWGAEATGQDAVTGANVTERHHAGTFVAGDFTRPNDLPSHGVVDHYGHAEVTVSHNGATYVDGGGYHLNFDFGSRQGTAEFRDLGGYDADVTVAAPAGKNSFTGDFSNIAPAAAYADQGLPTVAGSVDGAFFTGDGHAAKASAGTIGFESMDAGNPLQATGVFAGEKDH